MENILPAEEAVELEVCEEHSAEAIKSLDDIQRISDYLIANCRWRDNMLFVVGINFGLRIGDLLSLKFYHLIDSDMQFKHTFPILEQKTKETRKRTKNRYITINDAAIDAICLYLEHTPDVRLDDYMFRCEGNRGCNSGKPLTPRSANRILKEVSDALELNIRLSTHSFRKTFGYWQMTLSNNDPRKLLLLQEIFGHSSSSITLRYIGITEDEIQNAYLNLNLADKSRARSCIENSLAAM